MSATGEVTCKLCGAKLQGLGKVRTHYATNHPMVAPPKDAEVKLIADLTRLLEAASATVDPVAIDRVLAFASQRFGSVTVPDAE